MDHGHENNPKLPRGIHIEYMVLIIDQQRLQD